MMTLMQVRSHAALLAEAADGASWPSLTFGDGFSTTLGPSQQYQLAARTSSAISTAAGVAGSSSFTRRRGGRQAGSSVGIGHGGSVTSSSRGRTSFTNAISHNAGVHCMHGDLLVAYGGLEWQEGTHPHVWPCGSGFRLG